MYFYKYQNFLTNETLLICDSEIQCLVLLSELPFGNYALTQLCLGITISTIGLFLNITCIIIFSTKKQFKTVFFSYNKISSVKCATSNILDIFYYLFYNQTMLSKKNFLIYIISNNLWASFFTFGRIIECIILLYTIGVIRNKKFQFLEKRSPHLIGTLIFLFLYINNIPLFFQYSFDKKYFGISNSSKIYEVNNVIFTDFYSSSVGKILLFYERMIIDWIILIFEIIFNFYLLYLFQRQTKIKNALVKPLETISLKKISKSNMEGKRNVLMIIILCNFSLIQHFMYSVSILLENDTSNKNFGLYLAALFSFSFRNSVNLLFFYIFNTTFKKKTNNIILKFYCNDANKHVVSTISSSIKL